MSCDQCQADRINGLFCHETGCPNEHKTWVEDREQWVRFFECWNCGCELEAGTACSCSDPCSDEDESSWREYEAEMLAATCAVCGDQHGQCVHAC